ncbi:MAG: glycosyltransferase family 1 protein [Patescibacteria group bacterium]|nr:glycosyltransferase family 1 protein [Patescibacteria group bacterium]
MLIGIDASRANRDHKSGTEWYSYYLIRWLAKLDDKNQYILYSDKPLKNGLLDLTTRQHFPDSNRRGEIKFDKNGYQIIKSPYNNFRAKVLNWPFDFFWTLGRLTWEMLIHRPDALFVPAHTLPLIFPKKTMITIHDIAFEKNRPFYRADDIGPEKKFLRNIICFFVRAATRGEYRANSTDYLRWSTRFALKRAKKIITVSNFSKDEILKTYKTREEKIKVVYNGYNKLLYRKINDREKIKRILDKYGVESPFVLYVGRLEKKKNTPALLEAFCLMRENNKDIKHKLVLIGDASFGYDEAKYIIREFDLEPEIIMPGWVEEEDLPFIYNAATAFIFPTKYEGFGIPLLQAMSCQVPIAASCLPVLKEVAGEAALFFDPDDVNSIEAALKDIITDNKLKEILIEKGKERVENFSWEKCARETLEEINRL